MIPMTYAVSCSNAYPSFAPALPSIVARELNLCKRFYASRERQLRHFLGVGLRSL